MTSPDINGRFPLHYAALEDDVVSATKLLDAGADPNVADGDGFTPLHFAAQARAKRVAQLLLDRGAELDSTNTYGNTPLLVAVFNSGGNGDVIKLFRARGADPFRENNNGQTPIGLARLIANYDVAQFFQDLP